MTREIIKNIKDDKERAFYGEKHKDFIDINISGAEDGESAFKECEDINVNDSCFELRYPFWHLNKGLIKDCTFTSTARAAFWYDTNIQIENCKILSVKPFRECKELTVKNSEIVSEEAFWKIKQLYLEASSIESVYPFFEISEGIIKNLTLKGKYSFQYGENITIYDSKLDTKDAFWHTKNVTVKNSIIKGEYLAWYSENLTLINCVIIGTQPLCYCKNLKLVNCSFQEADLAFERSEVVGTIKGTLISIKNPLKGELKIDEIPELIECDSIKEGHFLLR